MNTEDLFAAQPLIRKAQGVKRFLTRRLKIAIVLVWILSPSISYGSGRDKMIEKFIESERYCHTFGECDMNIWRFLHAPYSPIKDVSPDQIANLKVLIIRNKAGALWSYHSPDRSRWVTKLWLGGYHVVLAYKGLVLDYDYGNYDTPNPIEVDSYDDYFKNMFRNDKKISIMAVPTASYHPGLARDSRQWPSRTILEFEAYEARNCDQLLKGETPANANAKLRTDP